MSSTDPDGGLEMLARFFDEEMLAAAGRRQFFSRRPDPTVQSYYRRRSRTRMTKTDFEDPDCPSFDALGERLTRLWSAQGLDKLAACVPALIELARPLYAADIEQSGEVSSFIYMMY